MFLGARLKKLRTMNNMTQSQLGERLNVTKVSVCCYENNIRTPSVETLEDLSEIFGVNCGYFLGKDNIVVKEDTIDYATYVSDEEVVVIRQFRKYKPLYKKLISDPKRTVELINKKMK